MFLTSRQKIQKAYMVDPDVWRALLKTPPGEMVPPRLLEEIRLRGKPIDLPPPEAAAVVKAAVDAMVTGDYSALYDGGRPVTEGAAVVDWIRRALVKLTES